MRTHETAVLDQFDPRASVYLASRVHAAGPDLERAKELVRDVVPRQAAMLDVGCGAGHLSFALAPEFARVVAADPSPSMLATVATAAVERGLPQIETLQASSDALPYGDATFMLVASRYSAHHWRDARGALPELRRVARPGGYLLIIDVLGCAAPLADTHLQAMELLRDPSHVRNLSADEWRAALEAAEFRVLEAAVWPTRLEFGAWIERMRTPPESVAAIRRLQAGAPREVWDALAVEPDGSFTVRTGLFFARARVSRTSTRRARRSTAPRSRTSTPGLGC
jgi:ubiquinone/menaquinone biosynthesis C-methylase UbiE